VCSGDGAVPQARYVERDLLQRKAKFDGLEVSDADRLRSLEEERARLQAAAARQYGVERPAVKKSGDARREAASGRTSLGYTGAVRAAGVHGCRGGPHEYGVWVVPGG
jgi:hypothetical protein